VRSVRQSVICKNPDEVTLACVTTAGPFIGFLIPCGLYNWYYSSEENRRNCPMKPPG
jgi:hypothetical protein